SGTIEPAELRHPVDLVSLVVDAVPRLRRIGLEALVGKQCRDQIAGTANVGGVEVDLGRDAPALVSGPAELGRLPMVLAVPDEQPRPSIQRTRKEHVVAVPR